MFSKRSPCHQNVTEITVRTNCSWRSTSWLLSLQKENLTAPAALLERGDNVVEIAGSCFHKCIEIDVNASVILRVCSVK